MPRDIRSSDVFRLSDDLVFRTYALTEAFPETERFGLLTQLRRAAVSVPVNLSEGAERESEKDFLRFVAIAAGSASEVRYLLSVARRLGYVTPASSAQLEDGYDHVVRGLNNLRQAIRRPGSGQGL